jgi:8-oxo-dGTP pyrophosphatase MutT (NUDIX family)
MSRWESLLAQLHGYEPFDELEARHRAAMVALLSSADAAFSRSHFEPGHFTASCFIIDDAGRLLLHHHRRLQRWLQMGGHVEGDESPQLAAFREGSEESGLADLALVGDAIFDIDVHAIPAGKGEPQHEHFDVRYLLRTSMPAAIRVDSTESNELAWFELERAAALMPGAESQRAIRKIERVLRERSTV